MSQTNIQTGCASVYTFDLQLKLKTKQKNTSRWNHAPSVQKRKKKIGRRRCVEREKTCCPLGTGGNIDTCVFIGLERKEKQEDDRANQIRHSAIRLPVMPRQRVYGNSRTGNFICSCHHLSLPSNYSFRNTSRRLDERRRLFKVLLPSGRDSS